MSDYQHLPGLLPAYECGDKIQNKTDEMNYLIQTRVTSQYELFGIKIKILISF